MPGKAVFTMEPPSEKQKAFLRSEKKFVAYGGARGGGKSWAVRQKGRRCSRSAIPGIRILLLRRTFPELRENHVLPDAGADLAGFIRPSTVDYAEAEDAFTLPHRQPDPLRLPATSEADRAAVSGQSSSTPSSSTRPPSSPSSSSPP